MFSPRVTLLIVLLGACLWGIYWIPIYLLENAGLTGPTAGLAIWVGAAPIMMIYLFVRRGKPMTKLTIVGALIAGIGMGVWGASVAFTDVVRAILLFYLLPVWSTILECSFLGRRFTMQTALAICCSLLGIVVICRGNIPISGLGALGDWLALSAGILFAIGMLLVFQAEEPDVPKIAFGTMIGSIAAGAVCVFFLQSKSSTVDMAPITYSLNHLWLMLAIGLIYAVPLLLIGMWSVTQVSPTTLSFVMTAEVIVGVATSAVFLDQLFGVPEIAGTALIVLGAVVEVIGGPNMGKPEIGKSDLEA